MDRVKKALERRHGLPYVPDVIPTDPQELLDLMDDASMVAATAQGSTAPAFDHGMRVFNQLNAHYQIYIARELAAAHQGMKDATNALKVATWWLAAITIALGAVELLKLVAH
jgi:hypothetical protein